MRAAGVTLNRPKAGRPDARPFIESLFHSIGPLIAAYFEGRTFGSVAEKGDYNPEHHISLQVDEVIQLFTFAICDIYHNKPHSGLGGASPHNAWVRAVQEHDIEYPSQGPEENRRRYRPSANGREFRLRSSVSLRLSPAV